MMAVPFGEQEVHTIEDLEDSREFYLMMFEGVKREKLEWYKKLFENKIIEAKEHIIMAEKLEKGIFTATGGYVKLPHERAVEQKANKSRMLLFWTGLLEEVRRRLS